MQLALEHLKNKKCSLSPFFHIPKQVGLSQATRLAQGKAIKFFIKNPFPIQIDGEPWIQQPGCLEITHHGQVNYPCSLPLKCSTILNPDIYMMPAGFHAEEGI